MRLSTIHHIEKLFKGNKVSQGSVRNIKLLESTLFRRPHHRPLEDRHGNEPSKQGSLAAPPVDSAASPLPPGLVRAQVLAEGRQERSREAWSRPGSGPSRWSGGDHRGRGVRELLASTLTISPEMFFEELSLAVSWFWTVCCEEPRGRSG